MGLLVTVSVQMKRILLTLLVASLIIGPFFCGSLFIFFGMKQITSKREAANWPTVSATVVSSSIYEHRSKNLISWCTQWGYNYTVLGRMYFSHNISPALISSLGCFPAKNAAEEELQKLPIGSTFKAYYNPQAPSSSAITPERVGFFDDFMVVVGGVFLFVGAAMAFAVLTDYRAHRKLFR